MKTLYESLLTGKVPKPSAKVQPSSKEELQQLISEHIEEIKPRSGQEVDLNWIDISSVDDLSKIFENTNYIPIIDTWKIDHVRDFRCMFAHNKYIVYSPLPVLQKKLLGPECYGSMFWDCASLVDPPELPATQLTYSCYYAMFSNCTALTRAPELPATKLTPYCYSGMFWGCSSLVDPPVLPATKLASHCYNSMFRGCSSLEEPPALPATKLARTCYWYMFSGCDSLKIAPELPATKLALYCYAYMFKNCISLEEQAKLPPDVVLDNKTALGMYADCPCENK